MAFAAQSGRRTRKIPENRKSSREYPTGRGSAPSFLCPGLSYSGKGNLTYFQKKLCITSQLADAGQWLSEGEQEVSMQIANTVTRSSRVQPKMRPESMMYRRDIMLDFSDMQLPQEEEEDLMQDFFSHGYEEEPEEVAEVPGEGQEEAEEIIEEEAPASEEYYGGSQGTASSYHDNGATIYDEYANVPQPYETAQAEDGGYVAHTYEGSVHTYHGVHLGHSEGTYTREGVIYDREGHPLLQLGKNTQGKPSSVVESDGMPEGPERGEAPSGAVQQDPEAAGVGTGSSYEYASAVQGSGGMPGMGPAMSNPAHKIHGKGAGGVVDEPFEASDEPVDRKDQGKRASNREARETEENIGEEVASGSNGRARIGRADIRRGSRFSFEASGGPEPRTKAVTKKKGGGIFNEEAGEDGVVQEKPGEETAYHASEEYHGPKDTYTNTVLSHSEGVYTREGEIYEGSGDAPKGVHTEPKAGHGPEPNETPKKVSVDRDAFYSAGGGMASGREGAGSVKPGNRRTGTITNDYNGNSSGSEEGNVNKRSDDTGNRSGELDRNGKGSQESGSGHGSIRQGGRSNTSIRGRVPGVGASMSAPRGRMGGKGFSTPRAKDGGSERRGPRTGMGGQKAAFAAGAGSAAGAGIVAGARTAVGRNVRQGNHGGNVEQVTPGTSTSMLGRYTSAWVRGDAYGNAGASPYAWSQEVNADVSLVENSNAYTQGAVGYGAPRIKTSPEIRGRVKGATGSNMQGGSYAPAGSRIVVTENGAVHMPRTKDGSPIHSAQQAQRGGGNTFGATYQGGDSMPYNTGASGSGYQAPASGGPIAPPDQSGRIRTGYGGAGNIRGVNGEGMHGIRGNVGSGLGNTYADSVGASTLGTNGAVRGMNGTGRNGVYEGYVPGVTEAGGIPGSGAPVAAGLSARLAASYISIKKHMAGLTGGAGQYEGAALAGNARFGSMSMPGQDDSIGAGTAVAGNTVPVLKNTAIGGGRTAGYSVDGSHVPGNFQSYQADWYVDMKASSSDEGKRGAAGEGTHARGGATSQASRKIRRREANILESNEERMQRLLEANRKTGVEVAKHHEAQGNAISRHLGQQDVTPVGRYLEKKREENRKALRNLDNNGRLHVAGSGELSSRNDTVKINTKAEKQMGEAAGRVMSGRLKNTKFISRALGAVSVFAGGAGMKAGGGIKGTGGGIKGGTAKGRAYHEEPVQRNTLETPDDKTAEYKEKAKQKKEREKEEQKSRQKKKNSDQNIAKRMTAALIAVAIFFSGGTSTGVMSNISASVDMKPKTTQTSYSNKPEEASAGDSMMQSAYALLKSRLEAYKNKIKYGNAYGYSFMGSGGEDDPFSGMCWQMDKYYLEDWELDSLVWLCARENGGSAKGIAFQMCLWMNNYDLKTWLGSRHAGSYVRGSQYAEGWDFSTGTYQYKQKDATGMYDGSGLVTMCRDDKMSNPSGYPSSNRGRDTVRPPHRYHINGGWVTVSLSDEKYQEYKEIIRKIVCEGIRILPLYINEHDQISDITSISTGSKSDRYAYIQDQTIVKNRFSSTYTFYMFPDGPDGHQDPFGYTPEAYRRAIEAGFNVDSGFMGGGATATCTALTAETFLEAVADVCATSRHFGYKYGNSTTVPPCTWQSKGAQGAGVYISCDRMVAKALYNFGFTDQPPGGLTLGELGDWLEKYGWEKTEGNESNNKCIVPGSIVLVKHSAAEASYTHCLVVKEFDHEKWTMTSYDQGEDAKITGDKVQPEKDREFGYYHGDYMVYSIPSTGLGYCSYDASSNLPDLKCISGTFINADGVSRVLNAYEAEEGVSKFKTTRSFVGAVEIPYEIIVDSDGNEIDEADAYEYVWDSAFPVGRVVLKEGYSIATAYRIRYDQKDVDIKTTQVSLTIKYTDREGNTAYQYTVENDKADYTEYRFYQMLLSVLTAGSNNTGLDAEYEVSNTGKVFTKGTLDSAGVQPEDRKCTDAQFIVSPEYLDGSLGSLLGSYYVDNFNNAEYDDEYNRVIKREYMEYVCDLFDYAILYGTGDNGFFDVEYEEKFDPNGYTSWTTDDGYQAKAKGAYHIEASVNFYVGCNPEDLVDYSKFGDGTDWTPGEILMIGRYYMLSEEDFWKYFELKDVILLRQGGDGGALPEVAKKIYLYLHARGISDECIAGILGNMAMETGEGKLEGIHSHSIKYEIYGSDGYPVKDCVGFGLIGWSVWGEDGAKGNCDRYIEYAKLKGKPWDDLDTQIEFLYQDLFVDKNDWNVESVDTFLKSKTPQEAAEIFYRSVEAGSWEDYYKCKEAHNLDTARIPEAIRAYNLMRAGSNIGGRDAKGVLRVPYICQSKGLWENNKWTHTDWPSATFSYNGHSLAKAGCGWCSTAMCLSYVLGEIVSPVSFMEHHGYEGDGAPVELGVVVAHEHGIPAHTTGDIEEVKNALIAGYPVMEHVGAIFTSAGHYIALVGYLADGTFAVNDPSHPSNTYWHEDSNGKTWSESEILAAIDEKPRATAFTIFGI